MVIKPPGKGWEGIDLNELWRFRELIWVFIVRDIKVRYKQTLIGIVWAFIRPITTVVIFNFIFGRLAQIPSEGIPYPLFSLIGVSLWTYFTNSLNNTGNSLIGGAGLINKVYFPRLILPISSAATPLLDLGISLVIMAGFMIYYKITPQLTGIILMPLLTFIVFLSASGLGFIVASLNIKYRDLRHALSFFIQLMMYATPVIYPSELLRGRFYWVMNLNPMAGVIEAARAGLLGNKPISWGLLFSACVVSVLVFLIGAFRFKKTERYFADII
ncbi:ABC transporter permease [Patescibacteria group bacterium]|nr:ABC transporter permease [Patescibacteria group bacterium]